MSVLAAFLVGLLTGILGMGCSLGLGILCVKWYSISGFEGASGYFVVFCGLAGGALGGVLGFVATLIAAQPNFSTSFVKGMGTATACWLSLFLIVFLACWVSSLGNRRSVVPQAESSEITEAMPGDRHRSDQMAAFGNESQSSTTTPSTSMPELQDSVDSWLRYWQKTATDSVERMQAAELIAAREHLHEELRAYVLGDDQVDYSPALYWIADSPQPEAQLVPIVSVAAARLIRQIELVNATSAGQDPGYELAAQVAVNFSAWRRAAATMRDCCQAEFCEELRRIVQLSQVRQDSHVMRQDVYRVASYYATQWCDAADSLKDPAAESKNRD